MDTFLFNQLTNESNKCLWLVLGGGLVLIQCARMHFGSMRTAYLKIANCIVISRRTAERVVGPAFVYGMWDIFLIFSGLSFVCWACVRGVKTHWAQVGL